MILFLIIILFLIVALGLYNIIRYKVVAADLVIGELMLDCDTPGYCYDFSRYNKDNKIVGLTYYSVEESSQMRKNIVNEVSKVLDRDEDEIEEILENKNIIPSFFYIKDSYIVYDRFLKTFHKPTGEMKLWR